MNFLRILFAVVFFCLCGNAFAQSSPGLYYGQVPTAEQWNSYFASKLDYNPNGGGLGQGVVTAYNLAAGAAAANLGNVGGGCLTGTWTTLSIQSACITTILGGGTAGIANFKTASYPTGLPLFAAGSAAFTTGTLSGNTQKLITADGTLVSGHCPQIDSYGGLVDSGAACGGGSGGSGTVTSGIAQQLAYYSSNGTTVAGLSTANNGALVTSSTGVPSISSVLPLLVQQNINAGNIGGSTLNSSIVNSSLTSVGTLGALNVSGTSTLPIISSGIMQNTAGNIYLKPYGNSSYGMVLIQPITPYNGPIGVNNNNLYVGPGVINYYDLATGTLNSTAYFQLNDGNSSPTASLYSGSGVVNGMNIYTLAGNIQLSAAGSLLGQTPSQGDNSTKVATTAFVQNPNNIGFQQPDIGSISTNFYNLLNQGMPIQVVPQFCSYATWNSTTTQAATSCVQAAATALCNRPVIGGVLQMPPGNPHFSDITFRCPTIVQGSGRGVTQVYNVGESSFVFKWEPTAWPAIPSTALMNGGGLFDIGVQNQVTSSGTIIQVHGMENFSTARVNIFNPWNGWESIGLEHADIQDYYLQGTYNLDWNFHGDLTGYTNSSTACTTSNNDCSTRSDFITMRSIENIDNRQTNTCFQFSGFVATIMMDHTACEGPLIGLNIVCPTGLSTTLAQCPHFFLSNDFQTEFWHEYGLYTSDFLDIRMKEPYSYGDYTSANGPTLAVTTVNYGSSNAAGQMTMEDGLFFATWQSDIYINGTLTDIMLSHNKVYGGNGGNAGYGAIDVEGPVTQVRIDNNTLCTVGGYSGGIYEAFGINIGSGVSKVQSENNSMYGCTKRLNNVSSAPYSVFSRNDVGPGGAPTLGSCGTATIVGTDLSFYVSITGGAPTSCTINFGSVLPEVPMFPMPGVAPGGTPVTNISSSTSQVVFTGSALSGTYLLTGANY